MLFETAETFVIELYHGDKIWETINKAKTAGIKIKVGGLLFDRKDKTTFLKEKLVIVKVLCKTNNDKSLFKLMSPDGENISYALRVKWKYNFWTVF